MKFQISQITGIITIYPDNEQDEIDLKEWLSKQGDSVSRRIFIARVDS